MFSDKCPICGIELISLVELCSYYCGGSWKTHYYEIKFKNDNLIIERFVFYENGSIYVENNFLKRECEIICNINGGDENEVILPCYVGANKAKVKSYIMLV